MSEREERRGIPGPERTAPFVFKDHGDGFHDAKDFLGGVYVPGRILLHEIKKDDPHSTYIGRDGNTDYYNEELGVNVLPGLTVIHAAVQAATAAALGFREGVPVINRAALYQEEPLSPDEEYVDFEATVEVKGERIKSGKVEIKNSEGRIIGMADKIAGGYSPEEPSEATDIWTRPKLILPDGYDDAHPLLRRIYNDHESTMLDGARLDEGTLSGEGIVIVGQNRNTEYFRGLRDGRIADMDLATAAVKLVSLIVLKDQEAKDELARIMAASRMAEGGKTTDANPKKEKKPDPLVPVFTGASFESHRKIPMKDHVIIKATATNDNRSFNASAVVLNPDGTIVASISGISGRLTKASVFNRKKDRAER